ncbi:hypothetical protein KW791_02790 [Candidatus Parcubacteria bacterium]|nr:hypothetical protein [Candidatus Parcubacteria bacterium]
MKQLKLLEVSSSVIEVTSNGPRLKIVPWDLRNKIKLAISYHPSRDGSKLVQLFMQWSPPNSVCTQEDLKEFLDLFIQAGKSALVPKLIEKIRNDSDQAAVA